MIFVHDVGIHSTRPKEQQPDLVMELKSLTGKVYRRADHFIQLAILGAHKAVGKRALPEKTAVYMTSGQGNISVFDRICRQRRRQNLLPRPVDFINLLSNSAGFYVASHLGLEGKNLFVTHHRFPVQMALLAAQNDLYLGKQEMVLLGGVDEWLADRERAEKLLGLAPDTPLGEASNWLLLGRDAAKSIAGIEVLPQSLDQADLNSFLADTEKGAFLAFSRRIPAGDISRLLQRHHHCRRFAYENSCAYYETQPLFVINSFLKRQCGELIHIDGSGGNYWVIRLAKALHCSSPVVISSTSVTSQPCGCL